MHSHVDSAYAYQETPAYGHTQSKQERILGHQEREESILYILSNYFHCSDWLFTLLQLPHR